MKCINKVIAFACSFLLLFITGCSYSNYGYAYNLDNRIGAFSFNTGDETENLDSFAKNICVTASDVNLDKLDMSFAHSAGLFSVDQASTEYAKNVHERMNPASLTKIMTGYIAIKYGKMDDILTTSANAKITEDGAQLCGFKEGDKMTLEQALYGLLMYSGNDVAIVIAEYISGSVEEFCKLMNEEAKALGATNTNFMNPHGLTEDNHYTCAYDLYLIFNEAIKYDKFVEIISSDSYSFVYSDRDGNQKSMDFTNTNQFLTGDKTVEEGVTIIGGKTGTTKAAGSCLVLLSKNAAGMNYISVILKANDRDSLYTEMNILLNDIK